MNTRSRLVAAFFSLSLAACGAAPNGESSEGASAEVAQGLTITVQTETELSGTFADGVVSMTFTSKTIADGVHQARLSFGVHSLDYQLNDKTAEVDVSSGNVAFGAEEALALRAFEIALGVIRNAKEPTEYTQPEASLFSLATLASDAAPGEVVPMVHKVLTRGWTNIGCSNTCRTLYGSVCNNFQNPYKQTGINSPNCKGRCGGGCGDARSNGATRWTMDCAEHDYNIGPWSDCIDDTTYNLTTYRCGTTSGEWCAGNCSCTGTGVVCL